MSARQFEVFPNPDEDSENSQPYFIVLQSDALYHLNTRLVAPLIAPKHLRLFERLMPQVEVEGSTYMVDVTNLGAIPLTVLRNAVANVEEHRYQIIAALDLVFMGI